MSYVNHEIKREAQLMCEILTRLDSLDNMKEYGPQDAETLALVEEEEQFLWDYLRS